LEVLLMWLEGSALGQLMRAAGVWSYGVVNLVHILGLSTLFGSVLALDLRLLGAWRRVPLNAIETPTSALAACGFAVAVSSGLALIATNATEYVGNPFLPIKFAAIGLGVLNVIVVQFVPAWRQRAALASSDTREGAALKVVGGTSLACWATAVAAGRMLGYW
jgi:hypothetical protein